MKHDFIPLVTFRGWSKELNKYVFGHYCKSNNIDYIYISHEDGGDEFIEVDKDSLGIYTGKDDKNGIPIFCGVAGAKYGSDIVDISDGDNPTYEITDNLCIDYSDCTIVNTHYEQHLKEETK